MLSQTILWTTVVLEAAILWRGLRARLFSRYPIFYSYLAFVLVQSLTRFAISQFNPDLYRTFYWSTDIAGVLIGSLVVFEIYKIGFAGYPGAGKLARNLLAFVFAMAAAKAIVSAWTDPGWWLAAALWDIELALRIVQIAGIVALVGLFLFYRVPFGRNLRGVLVAYGLYVSVTVLQLTALNASQYRNGVWLYAGATAYFVSLSIWVTHLWSYQPTPEPRRAVHLEQDYEQLAAATRRRLENARVYLQKVAR